MDVEFILERAKELLKTEKGLVPVLFVESENDINVVGITGDFNNIDRREMMMDIGRKFAKKRQRVTSISFVSEANVSRIRDGIKLEKCESIIVAKLDIKGNKREIVSQDFERSNDKIIFRDIHHELDIKGIFLLDAFVEGYRQMLGMELN